MFSFQIDIYKKKYNGNLQNIINEKFVIRTRKEIQ